MFDILLLFQILKLLDMEKKSKIELMFSPKTGDTEYYFSNLRSRFEKLDKIIIEDTKIYNEIKSISVEMLGNLNFLTKFS